MKRKGFTLAELLGVIVILGILTAIAVPIIASQVDKYKTKLCVTQYQNILIAAKSYGIDHLTDLNDGDTITLGNLIDNGYIVGDNLTDPVTKEKIDNELQIKVQKRGKKYKYYIIDNGKIGCTDFNNLYDENKHKSFKCKRATTLHTETCSQTDTTNYCSGAGYTASGSKGTTTITYGNLGTKGTLASGDAFDCDVNGDGTYNSTNERFYYVSGLNGSDSSNIAVLVYYNNVSGGSPNNTAVYAYDESNENWHGPRTAINQLPTTSQWSNVSLSNTTRAITNHAGGNTTTDGTNTHNLPTNFSYAGYAARLLTIQELNKACGSSWTSGIFDNHNYLMENTSYSNSSLKDAYWLETPISPGSINEALRIHSQFRTLYDLGWVHGTGNTSVRPVIEVNKSDINY